MARGRRDYEKAVIVVESEGYQDLHGRILMQDNFEDTPFKWIGTGTGTHFETRQQRAAYNGSIGAELEITSDAPPALQYSRIARYVPIDVTRRLQMEAFWRANDLTALSYLEMWVEYWDGTTYYRGDLHYNGTTMRWSYYDPTLGLTVIQGSDQTFYDDAWNELTLSVDFSAERYIRMKSNNMDINMCPLPCYQTGNPAGAHARIQITALNNTANKLVLSIDDAVLKELER